jgi:hypothetical protein
MNRRKAIVILTVIVLLGVILGGFVFAYLDKLYLFNQTKTHFQSLGFNVINMPIYVPEIRSVLSIVDLASFVSTARQSNVTTVFEEGYSFCFFASSIEYRYTPCNFIWWIWG